MREFNWRWKTNGVRKSLTLRLWHHGNPLTAFIRWLAGKAHYSRPDAYFVGHSVNPACYCPSGRTLSFRLELFGWGLIGWYGIDPVSHPCSCDHLHWLLFWPDYAEQVEAAGGLERLRAEYPDVKPLYESFPMESTVTA